jgi:hypothetical protein
MLQTLLIDAAGPDFAVYAPLDGAVAGAAHTVGRFGHYRLDAFFGLYPSPAAEPVYQLCRRETGRPTGRPRHRHGGQGRHAHHVEPLDATGARDAQPGQELPGDGARRAGSAMLRRRGRAGPGHGQRLYPPAEQVAATISRPPGDRRAFRPSTNPCSPSEPQGFVNARK